jgi:hypothetical protein
VNKISFIEKKPLNEALIVDMDYIDFDNKTYEIQNTLHDKQKELRT